MLISTVLYLLFCGGSHSTDGGEGGEAWHGRNTTTSGN